MMEDDLDNYLEVPQVPHNNEEVNYEEEEEQSLFWKIFGSIQLAEDYDRDAYIRATIREFFIFFFFLINICIITYLKFPTDYYFYTKAHTDFFLDKPLGEGPKHFKTMGAVEDFWAYANNVLLDGLYWDNYYIPSNPHSIEKNEPDFYGVLYENQIIGRARLRQLRVKNQTCTNKDNFNATSSVCFPEYKKEYEATNFSDINYETPDTNSWTYYSQDDLKGISYTGKIATYSGGGAYLILGANRSETQKQIEELMVNNWIDRSTRVIFLDFTTYSGNSNSHCVIKLIWEFPATGGLITSYFIRTAHFYHSHLESISEFMLFIAEIIFLLYTIYYTIQETMEMYVMGITQYILTIWTWLDIILLGVSYSLIFQYVNSHILKNMHDLIPHKDDLYPSEFELLIYWHVIYNNVLAICIFFSWIKIFKYITFNKTMAELSNTLTKSSMDIFGFGIIFFVAFFAFVQLGFLLMGSQLLDYSTLSQSFLTLLRIILGDINFRQVLTVRRVSGAVFFIVFVFFVFFILLNMFVAIINDTYSGVKEEISHKKNRKFDISNYFKAWINSFLSFFGCKNIKDEEEKEEKNEILSIYRNLEDTLINNGFDQTDIDLFFSRYEIIEAYPEQEDIEKNKKLTKKTKKLFLKFSPTNEIHLDLREIEIMELRLATVDLTINRTIRKMKRIISEIDEANKK